MTDKRFVEILSHAGYKIQSYSGRFMHGRECVGVVTGDSQADFALELADKVGKLEMPELMEIMRRMKWDNMGFEQVFYWPHIPFTSSQ